MIGRMTVKPEYYREQARRSRELAKKTLVKEVKSHLLLVAEEYEKLAGEAERQS